MDSYTEDLLNGEYLEKIGVGFKSYREYLYSGWEINQISNSLNNVYYKNELINTLKSLLLNGTNPKDIFILNSSVKIGKDYDFIKDGHVNLIQSQDIIKLYYMGSPIPLIPNEDTLKMFYLFEVFRAFYKKCKSFGVKPPNRRYTLHNLFQERTNITNATLLRKILNDKIYQSNFLLESAELDEKVSKLFKSFESTFKFFDNVMNDLELLNEFDIKYSTNIEVGLELDKYIPLNRYFNLFKYTFNSKERPIICVHKRQEQQLHFLCTDLISIKNFTENNYRFFETKNISQNSPLIIAIAVGLGFAPSLFKVGESLVSARRTVLNAKKEFLNQNEEMDALDIELDKHEEELVNLTREIEDLNAEIDRIEKNTIGNEAVREAIDITSEYTAIHEAQNDFVIDIVTSLDEKNNENFLQTLEEKELSVEYVKNVAARRSIIS
ncbi:hypothetical protein AAEY33_03955 [Peribacillus simplex]|uniref:hypothetical protein n=1 Tax=Peribacillus simplex TaxID=1478 RepID=UPI003264BF4E